MNTITPVLSLRDVSKAYGPVKVLKGVSCDFNPGEVHCLMGENGAGKSTLIRILSGAHHADSGEIVFDGADLRARGSNFARLTPAAARELGIATIYQELDLIPNLSGAENILLGRAPQRRFGLIDRRKMRARAQEILDSMHVSANLERPVRELGIAQQQMIAIAKSLTNDCRVLILDEPTAVFTGAETRALFELIRRMRERGIAIIFISHHMEEIFEIGDRVTVLRDGIVASSGPIADYSHDRLVRDMVGRDVVRTERGVAKVDAPVLLEVSHLGDGVAVKDVSLQVREGEIVGMAGLVGAGRTEVARLIFGADVATQGTIRLAGREIAPRTPFDAVRLGIGMVPEDRKLDGLVLTRSIGENVGYTLVRKVARAGLVHWSRVGREVSASMTATAVKPRNPAALVARLSGGNQQKVVLGRWLAAGVRFLILDEPTRGVDVGARSEIYDMIRGLAANGLGVLLISSDLPEVLSQSDRIYVMAKGRIAGELSADEATEEVVMALAFQTTEGRRPPTTEQGAIA
ncbi:sugar ABC transporter ATP-binding protein [Paraburkholderia sp. B3]|uniref:sugar ABC transporter ATP-binding protein n=1 Tax=Paraburkholderia sp. B3 TaxID=3134791 RepID=UPI00398210E5